MARTSPYYKRNQAHICSFFVKGECKRGTSCPYRHELPNATDNNNNNNELAHQNIKDRYYGVNDPVANKLINKSGITSNSAITPPQDPDIKTLFLSNVMPNSVTIQDLKDKFYSYGELKEVKIVDKSMCAFISYTTRDSAEAAIKELHNNLVINGNKIYSYYKLIKIDIPIKVYWSNKEHTDSKRSSGGPPVVPSISAPNPPSVVNPYAFAPPSSTAKPQYASMNSSQFGASYKKDR
jgi:pre-mRNA-splicing factor RBM22/SLT11